MPIVCLYLLRKLVSRIHLTLTASLLNIKERTFASFFAFFYSLYHYTFLPVLNASFPFFHSLLISPSCLLFLSFYLFIHILQLPPTTPCP